MITKLRNISAGKKLSLLVTTLILFVAISNIISISVLNSLTKNTEQIINERLVPSIILGSYSSLNQFIHAQILQDILESDYQKRIDIEKNVMDAVEKNRKNLAAYQETNLSPDEEVLINSMLSIYPKYLDAVTHALGLSRENKSQEAYDYIQTKGLAILNEVDDHIDSVNKLNIELAEQLRDVSSKQAASFTEQLNESVSQTSAASEHIAQNVQEIAEGADVFNHDSSRLR